MSTEEVKIPLPRSLQEVVGALLFASEQPLTAGDLRACIRSVEPAEGDDAEVMGIYKSCTTREIDEALHGLEKELERSGVGFKLVNSAGTYRIQTSPTCGRYVRALLKLDRPNRLSRASLETLAVIAYRQPIPKAEIEQIRGVAVDTIVKTLTDLGLVRLVGRSELPGHPFLYGTTQFFLEHFGLASLSDLNGIDPTLQRSNPRERAAAFKKPEPPAKAEETAADADAKKTDEQPALPAAETADAETATPEQPSAESAEGDETATHHEGFVVLGDEDEEVEGDEVEVEGEGDEVEVEGEGDEVEVEGDEVEVEGDEVEGEGGDGDVDEDEEDFDGDEDDEDEDDFDEDDEDDEDEDDEDDDDLDDEDDEETEDDDDEK